MAGTFPSTLILELNRLANGGSYPAGGNSLLSAAAAANVWAGTSGLDLVHALNVKAGNTAGVNMRDINGVCAQLSGAFNGPIALRANSLEGGTDTVAISPANSGGGSGNALDVVSTDANSTITYTTTTPAHGTLCASVQAINATPSAPLFSWTTVSVNPMFFRAYYRVEALPGANENFCRVRDSSNNIICTLRINSTGKLAFLYSAGTLGATSITSVPTAAYFRVEGKVYNSSTAGTIEIRLFNTLDSPIITETISIANVNTGSDLNLTTWQNGLITSVPTYGILIDDLRLNGQAFPGPFGTVASGTLNAEAVTSLITIAS